MIKDIINKKRMGFELTYQELDYMFNGYLSGRVKDYQMSSLLMAICINGMTNNEVYDLTKIFIDSGEVLDFSHLDGVFADKHSTGGIGDKTTLVVLPVCGSLSINMVKMSGRGLGYTGGTIDKLESIPGFRVELSDDEIIKQVKDIGIVLTSQSDILTPLDKVIYKLRDVSGTTNSIHLIAVSIMSKKIAAGADNILIDVKVGNGALINDMDSAKELCDLMVNIGKKYNKNVRCIISDMDSPLGNSIGNALEVLEAIDILGGKIRSGKLYDLVIDICTNILSMSKNLDIDKARNLVINTIDSGDALAKFLEFIKYQGGDIDKIKLSKKIDIKADSSGILESISAIEVGRLSSMLGAGRNMYDDNIDYGAGVVFHKNIGDYVKKGDIVCSLYTNKKPSNIPKIYEIK